ncbi:hypothetical protein OPV22_021182 [Ensete ventricosum]|uniref:UspA domain-containing protein n=1 Tax=Ensete ventricosum TaxID=4639 RepID=A0AAV8PAU9_ENSVE|nr:hypothetical protein OPV22_021182 [Ensete ventricosum]
MDFSTKVTSVSSTVFKIDNTDRSCSKELSEPLAVAISHAIQSSCHLICIIKRQPRTKQPKRYFKEHEAKHGKIQRLHCVVGK